MRNDERSRDARCLLALLFQQREENAGCAAAPHVSVAKCGTGATTSEEDEGNDHGNGCAKQLAFTLTIDLEIERPHKQRLDDGRRQIHALRAALATVSVLMCETLSHTRDQGPEGRLVEVQIFV